jgi:predicted metal-dependent phosphotriesterase family hydrolase
VQAIVRTVRGDIQPDHLGVTLPHEHVIQDHAPVWGDSDLTLKDEDEMVTELALARKSGVCSVADLSTIDTNRDLDALFRVSAGSGVHVIGGTGWFYGQHIPAEVRESDVSSLADIMERDVLEGSAMTRARAGVIGEIGWSDNSMLDAEGKVFEAAAIVHKRTGVPIYTHTTGGSMAAAQVDFLSKLGVNPDRIAVSHMDTNPSFEYQLAIAERGAYLSFDRISNADAVGDRLRTELIIRLIAGGYVRQLLLSQDTAARWQLATHDGRGYAYLITSFLPRLRAEGVDEESIRTMLEVNPGAYFAFTPPR